MSTTKEQEQQGLMAIKNIPESVEEKKSCIEKDLEGQEDIVEENTRNDSGCGLRHQLEKARADADDFQEQVNLLSMMLESAQKENDWMQKQLELELEWKGFAKEENVSQKDYDALVQARYTRYLTDEEAKDILYDSFGFAKEKVVICRSVPVYQINRHGQMRKTGDAERRVAYNSADWNYIRFDCGAVSYEMYNGKLNFFIQ